MTMHKTKQKHPSPQAMNVAQIASTPNNTRVNTMNTFIIIAGMLSITAIAGCWSGGRTESPQGGNMSMDESFIITVPTTNVVKQGSNQTVMLVLHRGSGFKRDIILDITATGISVTPTTVVVKASDISEVPLVIAVTRDSAIGDYRVSVKGTPKTGESTSTAFTVNVVPQ
jgi:hypothetical protein